MRRQIRHCRRLLRSLGLTGPNFARTVFLNRRNPLDRNSISTTAIRTGFHTAWAHYCRSPTSDRTAAMGGESGPPLGTRRSTSMNHSYDAPARPSCFHLARWKFMLRLVSPAHCIGDGDLWRTPAEVGAVVRPRQSSVSAPPLPVRPREMGPRRRMRVRQDGAH